MAVGMCFVASNVRSPSVREGNPEEPSLTVRPLIPQCGAYLTLRPISIPHIRRSSIEEFLRQITIESLQNCVFRLRACLVPLRNVDQSQIVMSSRIVAFEPDSGAQRFDRSGQTS